MRLRKAAQLWMPMVVVGLLALACLASLLLASRGGPQVSVLDGHAATIDLSDYGITPQSISVPAGAIRLTAHNSGLVAHNLTVEHQRLDSRGERVIVASTHTLAPGASRTISLGVLRAGRFLLSSTIANQADLGMTGTLVIR